ncbi:endonuclease V [Deinococcus sp. KNUC1210]|uniref:endonuclease V n=1 Tax=Deinococcus sp. KNUC1210 TaxID=2917691 RepID=UPI001EEF7BD7|nr:endonuclease V [Deinococcus sp. KNUC1210]ULH14697.1 endonuclease V [Deinococcus sp. KNUC1210]
MLVCTDVDYRPEPSGTGDSARAAAVLFRDWPDAAPAHELVQRLDEVLPYQPGAFYQRELPCLLAVLEAATQVAGALTAVVIDGYVTLDAAGRAGLGAYLYGALGRSVPVIGLAKTAFQGSPHALPLCRGDSQRPLYITAQGVDVREAARCVAQMAGPHRLPALIKRADQVCRRAP